VTVEVTNVYIGVKKEPKSQARAATPNARKVSELVTNAARPNQTPHEEQLARIGRILT